jgi:transcriptional regulator GlxA family with amidase domain
VSRRTVGIVVFEAAEVLDVCGPYEVFSVAGRRHGLEPFDVRLLAKEAAPVTARNGFVMTPHGTLRDAPPLDILVVPGGPGARAAQHDATLLAEIGARAATAELVLSVCTGALLLGRAGLLDGLDATTHHAAFQLLREAAPTATLRPGARFTDNGRVLTSAGVAAGIDLALHVVERLLGRDVAEEASHYMEFPRAGRAS